MGRAPCPSVSRFGHNGGVRLAGFGIATLGEPEDGGARPGRPPRRFREKTWDGRRHMAAHAGEKARRTGTFHCQTCNETVRVQEGETIPECPNGHKTFDERTDEPGNRS
jgi:hypothetical protein